MKLMVFFACIDEILSETKKFLKQFLLQKFLSI